VKSYTTGDKKSYVKKYRQNIQIEAILNYTAYKEEKMKLKFKALKSILWDEVYFCDTIEDEKGTHVYATNFVKRLDNLKIKEFSCNPGFDPLALLLDEEPKRRPEDVLMDIKLINLIDDVRALLK